MYSEGLIKWLEAYIPSKDLRRDTALRFAINGIRQQQAEYDAFEAASRKTKEEALSYLEEFRDKFLLPSKALPDAARKMRDELARVRKERDEAVAELHKLKMV